MYNKVVWKLIRKGKLFGPSYTVKADVLIYEHQINWLLIHCGGREHQLFSFLDDTTNDASFSAKY